MDVYTRDDSVAIWKGVTSMLKKAVLATLLFSMFLFFVCDIAQARDKYDTELLSRQMQFHHLEKADECSVMQYDIL